MTVALVTAYELLAFILISITAHWHSKNGVRQLINGSFELLL